MLAITTSIRRYESVRDRQADSRHAPQSASLLRESNLKIGHPCADAVRPPGGTCQFTMGNPYGGTVANVGDFWNSSFGIGGLLDLMASTL